MAPDCAVLLVDGAVLLVVDGAAVALVVLPDAASPSLSPPPQAPRASITMTPGRACRIQRFIGSAFRHRHEATNAA